MAEQDNEQQNGPQGGAPRPPDDVPAPDEAVEAAGQAADRVREQTDEGPGDEDAAEALEQARSTVNEVSAEAQAGLGASGPSSGGDARPFSPPEFDGMSTDGEGAGIDFLSDVNLHVKIELGRTSMLVEDVLKLAEGAVVELDKLAGDPVDVYVNGRHVARGEVLVLNDNFCVRVNEILDGAREVGL